MPKQARPRIVVLFLIHSLIGGGAERVIVEIINGLDRRRFVPVIAVGTAEGPYLGDLRADVALHVLGASRARRAMPAVVRTVRAIRPDIVLATAGLNLAVAVTRACFAPRTRVVLREANSPRAFLNDIARRSPAHALLYRAAYRVLYRRADAIVCQSDAMLSDLAELGVPPGKLARVYNPVAVERIQALVGAHPTGPEVRNGPRLISLGRLAHQKGFDVLLEAFVTVRATHPDATLSIFGEGPDRRPLERAAHRLGLAGAVQFPGFDQNPYPALARADLFVSSSRYEGFSNAIAEALACGVPVVATDCPSANREVLREGFNGWLSAPPQDPARLASTILRALSMREEWDREAIRRDCTNRFGASGVIASYEALFENLM